MIPDFVSRHLYRTIQKSLKLQASIYRKTSAAPSALNFGYYTTSDFRVPLGVHLNFRNTLWQRSWKTDIIEHLLAPGDGVFLDVGANVGQTLLDLRATHASFRYVGFEPNPACVLYLKELIRVNSFTNCIVVPAGLSTETTCVKLYHSAEYDDDGAATISSGVRPSKLCDVDHIACFRLDDLMSTVDYLNVITFIKIDIEGAELEALTGMINTIRRSRPPILCEVLFTDSQADIAAHETRNEKLMHLLKQLDYEVLHLHKSPDNARVADAKKIDFFASQYWTPQNKNLCDYLFIPSERTAQVLYDLRLAHGVLMTHD